MQRTSPASLARWLRPIMLLAIMFAGPAQGAAGAAEAPDRVIRPPVGVLETQGCPDVGEVLASPARAWRPMGRLAPSGVAHGCHWLRVPLPPGLAAREEPVLALNEVLLPEVSAFFVDPAGRVVASASTGLARPFTARPLRLRELAVPLDQAGSARIAYLRIRSHKPLSNRPVVAPLEHLVEDARRESLFLGALVGGLLLMVGYNAVIGVILRQRVYGLYVLHVLGLATWFTHSSGLMAQYVTPGLPAWNLAAGSVILPLAVSFSMTFTEEFLELRRRLPGLSRALSGAGFALVASVGYAVLVDYRDGTSWFLALSIVVTLMLLLAGVRSWLTGYRPAAWYTVAWSGFLVGSLVTTAASYGLLPDPGVVEHAQPIGALAEVTLLSLALAGRIQVERSRAEEARAHAAEVEATRERALSDQRNAMLRDLHDVAGHALVSLRERVRRRGLDHEAIVTELDSVHGEIRLVCQGRESGQVNVGAFLAGQRTDLRRRLGEAGPRLRWRVDPGLARRQCDAARLIHVGRSVREAVTNAMRHAGADNLEIHARLARGRDSAWLLMAVTDDGGGFDGDPEQEAGSGLAGMRERMDLIGGCVIARRRVGKGARVSFRVPLG